MSKQHTRIHHVARWASALAEAYHYQLDWICYRPTTSWIASRTPDGALNLRAARDAAGRPAIRLGDFYRLEETCAAISAASN